MEVCVVEVGEGKLLLEDIDGVFLEEGSGKEMLGVSDLGGREADGCYALGEKFFVKL